VVLVLVDSVGDLREGMGEEPPEGNLVDEDKEGVVDCKDSELDESVALRRAYQGFFRSEAGISTLGK
jgi:hypothetical protein